MFKKSIVLSLMFVLVCVNTIFAKSIVDCKVSINNNTTVEIDSVQYVGDQNFYNDVYNYLYNGTVLSTVEMLNTIKRINTKINSK